MDISANSKDNRQITIAVLVIIVISALVTLGCVIYQFRYYGTPLPATDSIYDYPSIQADCDITDIHWKNRDYDYLQGFLSRDSLPVTAYPTHMVFYMEDGSYYVFPVKIRNYYTPEEEEMYATKDLRGVLFHDREYMTNTGEPTDRSYFYTLIGRDNSLRNNCKIGFLIEIDGTTFFADTEVLYAYMNTDE